MFVWICNVLNDIKICEQNVSIYIMIFPGKGIKKVIN